jgi:two-component system cell cycle response regulator
MDVLIAHGAEASRRSLATTLAALGVGLREASDGPEALDAMLAAASPRVALVDWDLPRIEGPELCRLVRDFHVVDPPYVLLLAGSAHHDEVALGLEAGAHDCVRTPATAGELRARVEMARRFMELPWGREMSGCADALTGVLPREGALRRLDDELARARREHQEVGIGILDVDGLSRVNERFGVAAGDAVLRQLMCRVKHMLRPYDVVGRLDGEEFLVILSKTGEPDIIGVLDRLRAAAAAEPFAHDGRRLDVTVSLGGATGGEESAGELIARAQASLDQAQAAGPDRVVSGSPAVLEAVLMRD